MALMSAGGGGGNSQLAKTTAQTSDVISGKTFLSRDKNVKTGTLVDRPSITDASSVSNDGRQLYVRIPAGAYRNTASSGSPEIKVPNNLAINNLPGGDKGSWGATYTGNDIVIPSGYHNGSGRVGVNGGNRGNWGATYTGGDIVIPPGYHAGSGRVGVAGGNRGNWGSTIDPGGSVAIPQGYHNGQGRVYANGASSRVRVETGRTQWNLGRQQWNKGVGGTIFAAGITWADGDGGDISVKWSGGTMTVNNSRNDDTPVTFTWICAYYV